MNGNEFVGGGISLHYTSPKMESITIEIERGFAASDEVLDYSTDGEIGETDETDNGEY